MHQLTIEELPKSHAHRNKDAPRTAVTTLPPPAFKYKTTLARPTAPLYTPLSEGINPTAQQYTHPNAAVYPSCSTTQPQREPLARRLHPKQNTLSNSTHALQYNKATSVLQKISKPLTQCQNPINANTAAGLACHSQPTEHLNTKPTPLTYSNSSTHLPQQAT